MDIGDSFLYEFPHTKKHLCAIVCAIETNERGKVFFCTYFTTLRHTPYEDAVCIFKAGEHPFLVNDSYVDYSKILHITERHLEQFLLNNKRARKEPLTNEQLQRIKDGAKKSRSISTVNLKYFQ